jgi:3-hydroxybutyryl-CoA dehydratase
LSKASFIVDLHEGAARDFAELFGDWNPLHTDAAYGAASSFGSNILHGAFSAGLISRLAGMELPGRESLLRNMRLKFVAPVKLPARLLVEGYIERETAGVGEVSARVTDAVAGTTYVEARYEFSRVGGGSGKTDPSLPPRSEKVEGGGPLVLVTGATGAIGGALVSLLGENAIGASRGIANGLLHLEQPARLPETLTGRRLSAIVHCGWPAPDNTPLMQLSAPDDAIHHAIAAPLLEVQSLARLLAEHGTDNAPLVLVGSTAASPGRHNFRAPLYSLSKSLVPTLTRILAVELAAHGKRCVGVEFDVVDGGMNESLGAVAKASHKDRSLFGKLPSPGDSAAQIQWILDNNSWLASGAVITLTGGSMP